jgi:uncharacterized protein YjgD (DUF1641 family)
MDMLNPIFKTNISHEDIKYKYKYLNCKKKYIESKINILAKYGIQVGGSLEDQVKALTERISNLEKQLVVFEENADDRKDKIEKIVLDTTESVMSATKDQLTQITNSIKENKDSIDKLMDLIDRIKDKTDPASALRLDEFQKQIDDLTRLVETQELPKKDIEGKVKKIVDELTIDTKDIENKVIESLTSTLMKGLVVRQYYTRFGPGWRYNWLP